MKQLINAFAAALLLLLPILSSAQNEKPVLQARASIAEIEDEVTHFEVYPLQMPDGSKQYYLCLGQLFYGTHDVGIGVPVLEVFVFLGNTMDEALESMQTMLPWFDETKGTHHEVTGRITAIQPDGQMDTLQVVNGKTLSRWLDFYVERDGVVLNASINKSQFKTLIGGIKFYRKFHPNEI